ncbi:uncharacterized protein EI90DRAFT_3225625 [Cantharellus anzutake]|uniref:uncharacterized protein n=1 Tax=Cantharellus anzutake TaxID=1750568 RepID=UPI001905EC52|nr:uncharacterized protein EI90DRAFT_3225625 [Cantharellus anzutake]KAF8327217.1 hypothetical protein EI90DRAFT_3225625 [Cantharellus anzutake]
MALYPRETRSLVLKKKTTPSFGYHFDAVLETRPVPALKDGEVLVRIGAVSLNHRDLWQLKNLYPRTTADCVMGGDGVGTVIFAHHPKDPLIRRRVFFHPTRGWESNPDGPEEARLELLGGNPLGGIYSDFVVIHRMHVFPVPDYLPMVHAAAWPVAGVTGWRAVVIKANVKKGDNVLITGIGGGVALVSMQICLALGANVYVTSSSPQKIARAQELGAIDGVNYRDEAWPEHLGKILIANAKNEGTALLDSVIDSAGGDICAKSLKILKHGGIVVCYGMTSVPKIEFTMREVLRNVELKGSTMGSRKDLLDATAFMEKHRIVPEVSHVLRGLEEIHEGFKLLNEGAQIGKIVVKFPGREPDGSVRL